MNRREFIASATVATSVLTLPTGTLSADAQPVFQQRGKLDAKKRTLLREQLTRVRVIAVRHREATSGGAKELHTIAHWLAGQWTHEHAVLLDE